MAPAGTGSRRTVGIRDIPVVLFAPRRVFSRVEDVTAWGWPLVILLTAVTLVGMATVETGLIDREMDRQVQAKIAAIDETQRDVVELSELRTQYEQEYKLGEFMKLITRVQVVAAEPAKTLATALLVAAVLFGLVALTGRKPEWHTLLTICVYAGFAELLRLLARLAFMLHYQRLDVETSLAPIAALMAEARVAEPQSLVFLSGVLTGADPFRIWYWVIVAIGLSVTSQLRRRRAWLVCTLAWLAAAAVRGGIAAAWTAGGGGG